MNYALPNITAELLLRSAEATVVLGPDTPTSDVAAFIGGSATSHAAPGLVAAAQLGFVEPDASASSWTATPLGRLLAAASPAEKPILLRFQLESFEPYALFRNRLVAGEAAADAARQTVLRYQLSIDVLDAETVLVNWGTYSGGLVYGDEQQLLVRVNGDLLQDALALYEDVMAERDSVQAFIVSNLGVSASSFVTGDVLDHLVDGYLKVLKLGSMEDAIFSLGHAVEGFVKKVAALDPPLTVPASTKTLGKVAEFLRSQGRLNSKHHAVLVALTGLRNAADHSADPEIGGATWTISRETAFAANHLAWSLMRSFFAAQEGRFEL